MKLIIIKKIMFYINHRALFESVINSLHKKGEKKKEFIFPLICQKSKQFIQFTRS